MKPINLSEKLSAFSEHWSPKIVSAYNNNDVLVVKVQGEFNWHSHAETDDFFLVLKGQITIEMHEGNVTLNEGEMYIVPAGVEHRPIAKEEAHLLVIEPKNTPNTGDPSTAATKVEI